MADVFISYSKTHRALTETLARKLEGKGLDVWWDTDLLAGEDYRERIMAELRNCRAAIVIWTPESVRSAYVLSEAERARRDGKLVQARTAELATSVEELRALSDVSQAVNSTLDLATVLETVVAKSTQLSQTEAGAIYVCNRASGEFELSATYGMSDAFLAAIRAARGAGAPRRGAASTRRASARLAHGGRPGVRRAAHPRAGVGRGNPAG